MTKRTYATILSEHGRAGQRMAARALAATVPMMVERAEWTAEDRDAAFDDGWAVVDADAGGYLIGRRDDEQTFPFETDDDAQAHVEDRAREGSTLHQRAVAFVRAAIAKERG
jgi:hypothetical protein